MILEREIDLIQNESIREGTKKIVSKHEEWIKTFPPSPSGRYHKHEATMEKHIQDVTIIIEGIIHEFGLKGEEADILISAGILHDIGKVNTSFHGEKTEGKWVYHKKTGWSQYNSSKAHPFETSKIIKEMPFHHSDLVRRLVKCHMSRFCPFCPQPGGKLEYFICIADYFATKIPQFYKEIVLEG